MSLHKCILSNIVSFGSAVSEDRPFVKSVNQKQELPMGTIFVVQVKRKEGKFKGTPINTPV